MQGKNFFAGMAVAVSLVIIGGMGCASPPLEQPPKTSHMRSAVGTSDELSPLAPVGADNVRKVGNRWTCDVRGQKMSYNDAASRWEPQPK